MSLKSLSLTVIVFWGGLLAAHAQNYPVPFDASFRVSSMNPVVVSEDAKAVIRLDEMYFDVSNPGKATLSVRRAITILKPGAREYGRLSIFYDRLVRLKELNGRLLDAEGRVIRKLKKEDQEDYLATTEGSLYEDNRVRVASLYHNVYPYTVEFSYEIEYDGLINWPTWSPLEAGLPVEFARYDIEAPADMEVRYMVEGMDILPQTAERNGRRIFRWELFAQRAAQRQLLASLSPEIAVIEEDLVVLVAPAEFDVDGHRGDMSSWESFGEWYYKLSEGRDVLPRSVSSEVQRLVAGVTNAKDRAKIVYKYFQSNTRYVSVQLGLGSWQPFDAEYVAERGYGDCKALSNFLQALLKEAGVPSYQALILTGNGERDVRADFPSNQFNHVVVMAPMASDTLWLEATDQTAPFGHLGASNEDRYALVVRSGHSELVRTPRTSSQYNRLTRIGHVEIEKSGYATADIETIYAGNQQDHVRYALVHASDRDRIEWLHRAIDIPVFELIEEDFSQIQSRQQDMKLSFRLRLARYASRTGQRLFVPTNLLDRVTYVPDADAQRTKPVKLAYAYLDESETTFSLPDGYVVEAMPDDVALQTSFARYEARHTYDPAGSLTYRRTLEFTRRVIAPEQYADYRAFMVQVVRADRAQVVLVRE